MTSYKTSELKSKFVMDTQEKKKKKRSLSPQEIKSVALYGE